WQQHPTAASISPAVASTKSASWKYRENRITPFQNLSWLGQGFEDIWAPDILWREHGRNKASQGETWSKLRSVWAAGRVLRQQGTCGVRLRFDCFPFCFCSTS